MSENNSNSNTTTTEMTAYKTGRDLSLMATADLFVKSGMFPNAERISQAAVQIMAGQELGIGAFAADRAKSALSDLDVTVGRITHPSPANPKANRGWEDCIVKELVQMGIEIQP